MSRSNWMAAVASSDESEEHWIYIHYDMMINYTEEEFYFILINKISYEDIMPDDTSYPEVFTVDEYLYGQLLLQMHMTNQILVCYIGEASEI
jgi:hypothetical protein